MKYIFFFLINAIAYNSLKAQATARDFYPTLGTIKLMEGNSDALRNSLTFNDCVFGNCKNGEGVWMKLEILNIGSTMNGKSVLGYKDFNYVNGQIWLMKGVFSNNGELLKGRAYGIPVTYEVKSGSKSIKPIINLNFSSDENLKKYLSFEGNIITRMGGEKPMYTWKEGVSYWMSNNREDIKRFYGYFNYGVGEFVEIDYIKGKRDSVDRFVGITNNDESYLMGQIYYNDKIIYEGFFLNGKYHGPGKLYKNTTDKPLQGMWKKGELTIDMPIDFPQGTFDYKSKSENDFSLELSARIFQGKLIGNDKTGNVIFLSDDKKQHYFGTVKNGKANGLGYRFEADYIFPSKIACCNVTNNRYFLGKFNEGDFIEGTIIENTYYTDLKGFTPAKINSSTEKSGSFKNGMLNGCGSIKEYYTFGEFYTDGYFVNGEVEGWHYYKTDDKRFLYDDLRHKKMILGLNDKVYNELKSTISSPCNIASVDDVKSFLERKKKAYDIQQEKDRIAKELAKQKAEIATAECNEAIKHIGAIFSNNGTRYYIVGANCKTRYYQSIIGDKPPVEMTSIAFDKLLSYKSEMGRHHRQICVTCNGRGGYKAMKTTDTWGYRGGYDVNVRVRTLTHKMENTRCVTCDGKGYY